MILSYGSSPGMYSSVEHVAHRCAETMHNVSSSALCRLLEIKVDTTSNRKIQLHKADFQGMKAAARHAPVHRRCLALWSFQHG